MRYFSIAGGSTTRSALVGAPAHGHRQIAQRGVVAHFHGGVKAVAIAMDDFSGWSVHAITTTVNAYSIHRNVICCKSYAGQARQRKAKAALARGFSLTAAICGQC
jgi:hypothetical protein